MDPDVLCLEEANHFPDFWEPELRALGYTGAFCPKYDPSYPPPFNEPPAWMGGQPSDGCALFAKRGRWALRSHLAHLVMLVAEHPTAPTESP